MRPAVEHVRNSQAPTQSTSDVAGLAAYSGGHSARRDRGTLIVVPLWTCDQKTRRCFVFKLRKYRRVGHCAIWKTRPRLETCSYHVSHLNPLETTEERPDDKKLTTTATVTLGDDTDWYPSYPLHGTSYGTSATRTYAHRAGHSLCS